jgi:hypothetical protein
MTEAPSPGNFCMARRTALSNDPLPRRLQKKAIGDSYDAVGVLACQQPCRITPRVDLRDSRSTNAKLT